MSAPEERQGADPEPSALDVLLERLDGEAVSLRLERNYSMARRTTLRVGGCAAVFCEVDSAAALAKVQEVCRVLHVPLVMLGRGANVLVPDEGLAGVVCRLSGDFETVVFDGAEVTAGAAVTLAQVAKQAVRRGLGGLEALAGFPASVGGAVVMNAGCYGVEIQDVLLWVEVLDPDGSVARLTVGDLDCGYRHTNLSARRAIVVRAAFRLTAGDRAELEARMDTLNRRRWASLPSGSPSAGSVFRNPLDDSAGRLIEACGLKGVACGKARISQRHGNVIVNEGGATAGDVFELMLQAHRDVRARFGVSLVPELVLLGNLADAWWRAVAAEDQASRSPAEAEHG